MIKLKLFETHSLKKRMIDFRAIYLCILIAIYGEIKMKPQIQEYIQDTKLLKLQKLRDEYYASLEKHTTDLNDLGYKVDKYTCYIS